MPTVSGKLCYDPTNLYYSGAAFPAAFITNVPIVLQNISTGVGLVVLTDASGNFVFNNVPNATYQLVEAWGAAGGVVSPGDFSTATVIPAPTPLDPPLSQAPTKPIGSTRLQSLSPNTITPIVVSGANITGQNFVDGPIAEKPLNLTVGTIGVTNLITAAGNGQWGTLPAGTVAPAIPATEPYPGYVPSEGYVNTPAALGGAKYTVTNIFPGSQVVPGAWINAANHSTFDETGRMQAINAAGLGIASNERFLLSPFRLIPIAFILAPHGLLICCILEEPPELLPR